MLARGLTQKEVSDRLGWHTSNTSRIVSGKTMLSAVTRQMLARLFQCAEGDLLLPVGSAIPQRSAVRTPVSGQTVNEFNARLKALLTVLNIRRVEDLMLFLVAGDFTAMPPKLARQLSRELNRNENHQPDDDG